MATKNPTKQTLASAYNEHDREYKERQALLMTEEEFERRKRTRTKENINRILRVLGLIFGAILIYAGILDALFEASYFGFIFTKEEFTFFWEDVWRSQMSVEIGAIGRIFDDPLRFQSPWLVQIAFTIIIVAVVLFSIYVLTYTIIDFVNIIKSFFKYTRIFAREVGINVKQSADALDVPKPTKKSKKDKDLFAGEDVETEKQEEKKKVMKKPVRRTESDTFVIKDDNGRDYTTEELDLLLQGKPLFTDDENEK